MSEDKGVCEGCPALASLEAAEQLVNANLAYHNDPQRALGGICLSKASLEGVAKKVECPGPAVFETRLHCPIQTIATEARTLASGNWPPASYKIELAELAPDTTDNPTAKNTGQYL